MVDNKSVYVQIRQHGGGWQDVWRADRMEDAVDDRLEGGLFLLAVKL